MMIFVKTSDIVADRVIIPSCRIYDIWAAGSHININYDSGELVEIEGTYQKKIETATVVLKSDDEVDKLLRQFYKACNNNVGAFYFGNNL